MYIPANPTCSRIIARYGFTSFRTFPTPIILPGLIKSNSNLSVCLSLFSNLPGALVSSSHSCSASTS
jgi:hypothetical protein